MSPPRILVAAALGAGVIALSTLNASADVVCSGNVCWHAHERYEYPPSAHITTHEDAWKPGPGVQIVRATLLPFRTHRPSSGSYPARGRSL